MSYYLTHFVALDGRCALDRRGKFAHIGSIGSYLSSLLVVNAFCYLLLAIDPLSDLQGGKNFSCPSIFTPDVGFAGDFDPA